MGYVIVLLAVCVAVGMVEPHGYLKDPPARGSMWILGWDTPKNYNHMQMFCGGKQHQYETNGGKCGVCGDPYDAPKPRDNEGGGAYSTGIISKCYEQTSVIEVKVEITANHLGYFEFRLCEHNDPFTPATQECLDEHVLTLYNGMGTRYNITSEIGEYTVELILPEDVQCSQCVLQWKYNTGNSWGCDGGVCDLGYGKQEQFYGCSDVSVLESCENFDHYQYLNGDVTEPSTTTKSTTTTFTNSTPMVTTTSTAEKTTLTTAPSKTSTQTTTESSTTKTKPSTTTKSTTSTTTFIHSTPIVTTTSATDEKTTSTTTPSKTSTQTTTESSTTKTKPSTTTKSTTTTSIHSTPIVTVTSATDEKTTSTTTPSKTSTQTTTDSSTTKRKTTTVYGECYPKPEFEDQNGDLGEICQLVCSKGLCLSYYCRCDLQQSTTKSTLMTIISSSQSSTSSSTTPSSHTCEDVEVAETYKGVSGMLQWCVQQCLIDQCPQSHCIC